MRIIRYEPLHAAGRSGGVARRASYNPPHYVERLTGQQLGHMPHRRPTLAGRTFTPARDVA
ncbi:hypothetical protein [Dickeya dianthicola]|uniref:hypothetical protein n=1 Tax=Dickeya dianthicola TaxID=204039 RepID=UPI00131A2C42|nr:hypothetical protein [Dickeya dianthicola]MBI0464540.1 hypothetical protein [Dickeya dianthicola]MBI0481575.1 hypothetical protein [Dickeya dianthicola]MBI0488653.1 hypothetical protein [Dickeya dianthicola]MBI0513423.1 hypothetical protein [Dickeya dianthicola]MBI0525141.1 hypothetical protein [Dickeya dianthicola]